jgi:hypothetical protein
MTHFFLIFPPAILILLPHLPRNPFGLRSHRPIAPYFFRLRHPHNNQRELTVENVARAPLHLGSPSNNACLAR